MFRYIIYTLVEKFNIGRDEAILFFYDVYEHRKVEHLLEHVEEFKTFDELKKFYLGEE